jgi:hypothetical protein
MANLLSHSDSDKGQAEQLPIAGKSQNTTTGQANVVTSKLLPSIAVSCRRLQKQRTDECTPSAHETTRTRMNTGFYVQSIMGATLSFLLLSFIKSLLFPPRGSDTTSRNFPQNAPVSSPRCYMSPLMASILKVGDAWRAQIRRKGHKSMSEALPTTARKPSRGRGRSRLRWMPDGSTTLAD